MPVTEAQLIAAHERVESLRAEYERAAAERSELIRQAAAEGWTHRRLSTLLDVNQSRIGQLLKRGGD